MHLMMQPLRNRTSEKQICKVLQNGGLAKHETAKRTPYYVAHHLIMMFVIFH